MNSLRSTCLPLLIWIALAGTGAAQEQPQKDGANPQFLIERRPNLEARVEVDSRTIRLSGECRLTLSVEAPGPLVVVPTRPLLVGGAWRIWEEGLPMRELLPGGRQKWSQAYRISPLVHGKVPVMPASVKITAGTEPEFEIRWDPTKSLVVQVLEPRLAASIDSLRPPTGPEEPPPPIPATPSQYSWRFAIVPALLAIALAMLWFARRQRTPASPRDEEWLEQELRKPNIDALGLSRSIRAYLSHRLSVSGQAWTTPEWVTHLRGPELDRSILADSWVQVLEGCDVACYSGIPADVGPLIEQARATLAEVRASLGRNESS